MVLAVDYRVARHSMLRSIAARLPGLRNPISAQLILQEFGCSLDARYQQTIGVARARHIKQVPFAVVELFKPQQMAY